MGATSGYVTFAVVCLSYPKDLDITFGTLTKLSTHQGKQSLNGRFAVGK